MIKRTLIICAMVILITACGVFKRGDWINEMPASIGEYDIQTVANEMGLVNNHAIENPSECGLSANDFIKYVRDRVDGARALQFIVFVDGKPLVGDRCYRKAFIFYLKEK